VTDVVRQRTVLQLVRRTGSAATVERTAQTVDTKRFATVQQVESVNRVTQVDNNRVQGDTGSDDLQLVAGMNLGGERVVIDTPTGAIYADSSNLAHANCVVGVTLNSALHNDIVNVRSENELEEPSWSWTPGAPIYLGLNGLMTQVQPSTGFNLQLGYAVTATRIYISIGVPILLV
jgi:hypothetical protein